jgi:putative ABC transport system permease protein
MRTSIAWRNVLHDKRRTLAAMSGVAFAIVLIFMQLGFYLSCRISSTMMYDALDFDAILVSKPYVHLRCCNMIPRARIEQAGAVPGVASATPVYVATVLWRNPETSARREVLVLGVNPTERPFRLAEINRNLPLLQDPDTAIMDQEARPLVGSHGVGTVTEANGRRIEVVAEYSRGVGLVADGSMVVSDETIKPWLPLRSLRRVQLGLVRFEPGADPDAVLGALRACLPDDTRVWSRAQLVAYERNFFLNIKPLGIMFTSGLLVGLAVGAVILYQVLSADIANQIRQYATLKAMGYGPSYLYGVVMKQGFLFALLAYCPAVAVSVVVYAAVRHLGQLPMYMTPERLVIVFVLSVVMCTISGLLAIRKVNAADPADLF